jgi:CubicO group peptidase (beta-lactamase class C family)
MKLLRLSTGCFALFLLVLSVAASSAQVPGEYWEIYKSPEEAGWSSQGMAEAEALFVETGAAAFMVIYDGRILAAWGNTTRRFMCHSVRKSFLSGLYGVYVDAGAIDLDKTMAELGIEDTFHLSDAEKRATIRDLLKARSGVYHPAAYETQAMKARRPERGSHERDTFWYYNNWDFNTLGAVFARETGDDVFEAFERRIAAPIHMEDYRVMDGYYHLEAEHSQFPAYPFKMSARDMARYGLLFLREGEWDGKRVISRGWIEESTTSYSGTSRGGYAYLWWTDKAEGRPDRYFALGYGGHIIGVWPEENLVFVQRVDTYTGKQVGVDQAMGVLDAVMAARVSDPAPDPELVTFDPPKPAIHEATMRKEMLHRYVKSYTARGGTASVEQTSEGLLLASPAFGNFRLIPVSKKIFFVEDLEYYAVFDFEGGEPERVTLHATREVANLYSEIVSMGADEAMRRYSDAIDAGTEPIDEYTINGLGYELLGSDRVDEAIKVFEMNVALHPQSSNAYDSLGEAFATAGDTEAAIRNYKKALELNPGNGNAEQRLRALEAPASR